MSEWRETTLGEIITLQRGHDLTEVDRTLGTVPVIGSAGQNGWHNVAKAKGPGVTVGRSGASAGVVTYVREDFWPHNTALYVKDFKGNDPLFVAFMLRTLPLAELNSGAAQPSLNRNFLYPVPVRVPDVVEQRRIAGILGAYDDLIEVNRRRVAVLEDMARGLFDEWFVRLRFPGHESVPLRNTPDGPLPEGWRFSSLGEVAAINATSLKPAKAPEEIGYIDIASVSPGQIDAVNWMPFAEAPGRARRIVKDGSILWSNVRPNRRSHALVLNPAANTIASTGFTVLDAEATSFAYLYHWVTTDAFVGYLVGNAGGAAYPAVTAATFERATVLMPDAKLVERFTAFATPLMRQAETLRATNQRLAASRDLLLPRLMSGGLSVAEAQKELEIA